MNFGLEYLNKLQGIQKTLDIVNSPAIQQANLIANNVAEIIAPLQPVLGQTSSVAELSDYISFAKILGVQRKMDTMLGNVNITEQYQAVFNSISPLIQPMEQLYSGEHFRFGSDTVQILGHIIDHYEFLHIYPEDVSDEEIKENEEVNNKILSEIFVQDENKAIDNKNESAIITLSPINDNVLKYLSENPEALYQLSGNDFEIVMAELYSKLGYDVTRTQATRDGGKDLIIRKPEVLGDFIYYVECKKYDPKRHIGVGIVRNLVGTVTTDRVNGGILATTSFFSADARKFVLDNKLDCQIKMHDYNTIRTLLNRVV